MTAEVRSDDVEALRLQLQASAEREARLEVECQLWREALASLRDLAANYAPAVAQSSGYEPIRAMMADDEVLSGMVDRRLEEERARRAPEPPTEEAEG